MPIKSHAALLKRAKNRFNLYIRVAKSDINGNTRCCTCGKPMKWNECDAGHFEHGLDFQSDNQHPQGRRCNYYLSGNLKEYAKFMLKQYGADRVDELHLMKGQNNKYSRSELAEMIKTFNGYIRDEKKKRGI